MTIYSIFNDLTSTDPPNHPPIHLSKGGSVSTNHKSSKRIELSQLDQVLLKFLWFHMFWPTNPPIHPPTQNQKKHPPMGGEFSTNSKSLNGIEISRFVQVLSHFYWFGVTPLGVDGWWWGWVGVAPTHMRMCTHMHTHARMCTHTCMHVKHDKHGCLHGGSHLQFPNMFILAIVHVPLCMCTCLGTPPMPSNPSAPSPEPQGSCREPKSPKVYTNWDNSILFEKIFTSKHSWTNLDSLWSP